MKDLTWKQRLIVKTELFRKFGDGPYKEEDLEGIIFWLTDFVQDIYNKYLTAYKENPELKRRINYYKEKWEIEKILHQQLVKDGSFVAQKKELNLDNTVQKELCFQFGCGPYTLDQLPEIIDMMGDFVEGLRKAYLNNGNQEKVLEYKNKAEEYRRCLNQANKRIEELEEKVSKLEKENNEYDLVQYNSTAALFDIENAQKFLESAYNLVSQAKDSELYAEWLKQERGKEFNGKH